MQRLTDGELVDAGGVRAHRNIQAVACCVTVAMPNLACDARELLQTQPYARLNLEMTFAHTLRITAAAMPDEQCQQASPREQLTQVIALTRPPQPVSPCQRSHRGVSQHR
jgi:hypothetical protein